MSSLAYLHTTVGPWSWPWPSTLPLCRTCVIYDSHTSKWMTLSGSPFLKYWQNLRFPFPMGWWVICQPAWPRRCSPSLCADWRFPFPSPQQIFAFEYGQVFPENGWKVYDAVSEYKRQVLKNGMACLPWLGKECLLHVTLLVRWKGYTQWKLADNKGKRSLRALRHLPINSGGAC